MKAFMIAGIASGVGKTTVSLAIIAAMRRRGLIVQCFKGGPDFLDTGHHTRFSGRVSRNLDTWMLREEANEQVLQRASRGAEVLLVEGMMGLFDGKDSANETGSSAEIAKLLKLPVVLVLDAGKSARSIAAVVMGFEMFDPELSLAGVILNRVASERHYRMLKTAILTSCKTPLLGWLPKDSSIAIPERHLGLQSVEEREDFASQSETLAKLAEDHLDLDGLLKLECGLEIENDKAETKSTAAQEIRIGVARDRAFSFYYEDNLDLLRTHGALIVPFSPLDDDDLPPDLDALYLGGGYPELYVQQLSHNKSMLKAMRDFASSMCPIYAECGGMIYLSRQLTTIDKVAYTLADVLPLSIEMTNRLVQFGYATVNLTEDCLLGSSGTAVRGHSFHYSHVLEQGSIDHKYRVLYSLSGREQSEGYSSKNVLASYIHLHFGANEQMASSFIQAAAAVKAERMAAK